jgi:hypothetical protein
MLLIQAIIFHSNVTELMAYVGTCCLMTEQDERLIFIVTADIDTSFTRATEQK